MKPGGILINREWVLVLHSGAVVIDWGDNAFQDVDSGEFLQCSEGDISHHIYDDELEMLRHGGRVSEYDPKNVWFVNLPERRQRTIE